LEAPQIIKRWTTNDTILLLMLTTLMSYICFQRFWIYWHFSDTKCTHVLSAI